MVSKNKFILDIRSFFDILIVFSGKKQGARGQGILSPIELTGIELLLR